MSSEPLISVTDLGTFLQQDLSDYEEEATYAVTLASEAVRSYCRRTFTFVEDDVRVLRWRELLVLPNAPIVSITSVQNGEVDLEYARDARGRIACPGDYGDDITVTYTHGYAEIPGTVEMVTVRCAARIFKNPLGRVTFSADNMNYSGSMDTSPRILTGDEMAALSRYRLFSTTQ